MSTLSIDLQDGFADDTVVISVDGQEVFGQSGVRTRRTIGWAASVETPVGTAPVRVEVSLPSRRLAATTTVNPDATPYVGVSVIDNQVRFATSHTPFGYA